MDQATLELSLHHKCTMHIATCDLQILSKLFPPTVQPKSEISRCADLVLPGHHRSRNFTAIHPVEVHSLARLEDVHHEKSHRT